MKKLISFMGAVVIAVSFCIIPCSAVSSTTPAYSVELNSSYFREFNGYQYFTDTLTVSSSQLGSTESVGHPVENTASSSSLSGTPTSVVVLLHEATTGIGSILFQGNYSFSSVDSSVSLESSNALVNGEAIVEVRYSDGTSDSYSLTYGTDFYVTSYDTGYQRVVFYCSVNINSAKAVSDIYLMFDHANGEYFGIENRFSAKPSYIQVDFSPLVITFTDSSGGGGSDPDDPDDPGTGGGTGGDTGGGSTSQEVLNAIMAIDQTVRTESAYIQMAISNLGDRLANVDAETAEKMLEAEVNRQTVNNNLADIEENTSQFFTDLTNRFQELGLEGFAFPVAIISGFQLMGNLFTQVWNAMDDYKVVYLFPLMLSVALVIIGRISRSGKRVGSGASNNADREGEVIDA